MFHRTLCLLLAIATCAGAQISDAQPGTSDEVQQAFPIEAARVIAWLRNQGGEKIVDVRAEGESKNANGFSWSIVWRDGTGKTVRERRVQVAPTQYGQGAGFYRDVFAQLAADDWQIQSSSPDNSATAFWQGAELAGPSRVEAMTAAGKLIADKPRMERAADAARLAGVLVHAALPTVASRNEIDRRLLARGAAWLCIAEKRLHEPMTAAWGPLLFLAGREGGARDAWRSPEAVIKMRTAAERFWSVALGESSVQQTFNFAARKENRAFAIPAMILSLRKDARLASPLAEITGNFGSDYVQRFHDYAPVVSDQTTADAAWKRFSQDLSALPAAVVPPGLPPVAYFAANDVAEATAGSAAATPKSAISELSDDQIAGLAKAALAAAASEPEQSASTANPTRPSPREDIALGPMPKLATAEEAWAYLQKLKMGPGPASSPEDGLRRFRAWLERQRTVAEQFAQMYPDDPRRWEAVTIAIESAIRQRDFDQVKGRGMDETLKALDEVIEAAGASREVKGTAAFLRVVLGLNEVNGLSRHTLPPFHRKLSEFLENYPNHPRAVDAAALQIQLLQQGETPGADKILEKLSNHANAQIASQAKALFAQRARIAELKKKPIELKFTAADGKVVDAAKLRGKVLLLDFWASWCGPCMAEAPNVVAAYKKLHERGFEIVGICLDQDKAAMEAAIERAELNWPHHFDGKGWQDEIVQRFGIQSIPSTWLFDKSGKLRQTGLRGEELEASVESLLKE